MAMEERVAFLHRLPEPTTDRLAPATRSRTARRRIVIVDERRLFAEALVALVRSIDGAVRGELIASNASAGAIAAMGAQLVLVAVGPDREKPLRLITGITELAPGTRTVLIADECNSELVKFVLDNDVAGLLLSDSTAADLTVSLQQILQGHTVLPAGWHRVIDAQLRDPLAGLSERQHEVLVLVAAGYSYSEIAARLFISVNTVKFHLRSIYRRLGVRNRMAAARLLADRGMPRPVGQRSVRRG